MDSVLQAVKPCELFFIVFAAEEAAAMTDGSSTHIGILRSFWFILKSRASPSGRLSFPMQFSTIRLASVESKPPFS